MSYGAGSRLSKGGTDAETTDCRVGNRGVFGWVLKFNKNGKGGTGNHWHGPVPQMSNQQVTKEMNGFKLRPSLERTPGESTVENAFAQAFNKFASK